MTLDQSREQGAGGTGFASFVDGPSQNGQTFTAGLTGALDQVDVNITRAGAPGNLTVAIHSASGGLPSGARLASETVAGSAVSLGSWDWISIPLDPPAAVSTGTQYAIVLSAPSGSNSNEYDWAGASGNPYAGGTQVFSSDGGATFSNAFSDNDMTFRTYVSQSETTPPTVTCSAAPTTLWPPNHTLRTITASVFVSDTGSGPNGFRLVSVTSSQADAGFGADDVPNDIQNWAAGTADTTGELRAERFASVRTYMLSYRGFDVAGNSAVCTATVNVPRNQK